ncbi:MAG: 4Fe-4S dicluster domain-containing protein [Gammaproteobacteria bacterium]|jgi:epoxyqueuosine reductase|nr:4Fe-4S dicluster domain-containing protein [Gammaproteobacteria bacterium]
MKKAETSKWQISEEQRALLPSVSGNEINGLGETQHRLPDIVYWPNDSVNNAAQTQYENLPKASKHPYGPLVNFMRQRSAGTPIRKIYTDFENRAPKQLDDISSTVVDDTAENWTEKVKEFVLENEGNLVGVTALKSEWFYTSEETVDLPWVVVIGVSMDYEKMQHVPPTDEDLQSAIEVGEKYNQVDRAAGKLANWIRAQGWDAENQGGPNSGKMLLTPAALACGFGELGKHGSIINREFGSIIRLSCVRTSLPLVADDVDIFGADDFCTQCQVCSNACPVDAIASDKQMVRGEEKWYVNFDKCVPYFNENYACAICISVCPWSRPGVAPKMAEKMTRRKARKEQQ